MKAPLSLMLTAGFAAVILLMTLTNIFSINLITRSRYTKMVQETDIDRARTLAPFLAELYREQGSWISVRDEFRFPMQGRTMGMNRPRTAGTMRFMSSLFRVVITEPDGTIVLDTAGALTGSRARGTRFENTGSFGIPVTLDGNTIGYVYVRSMIEPELSVFDSSFLQTVQTAVILSALAVSVLATLITFLFLRYLTSPLRRLSVAVAGVAEGNLTIRVPEEGSIETATLGRQFNTMVESLQNSRNTQKRLVADSAHELRTPITLIQGTLEMMLDGIYSLDRPRIESLYEETVRLGKLVAELRELSQADEQSVTLRRTQLDAGAIVRESVKSFEAAARKASIRLETDIQEKPIVISADGERLARVLSNLISNALRYTPSGGTITIGTGTNEEDSEVLFSVSDTGPGIPEHERERIFERFYRLDESRSRESGGSGLGLAISREIVHAHGGWIRVDPSRTTGARFLFAIPRKTRQESVPTQP